MTKKVGRLSANFKKSKENGLWGKKLAWGDFRVCVLIVLLACCSLVVARWSFLGNARCVQFSALLACSFFCCFSPLDVSFTLLALRCLLFAINSSFVKAPIFLFAVLYSPLASRSVFFVAWLLLLLACHSPISVRYTLLYTCCSLFPNLMVTRRSLIAIRKPWIVARCSLRITRFLSFLFSRSL